MKKLTYEMHGGMELISFQNFAAVSGVESNNTSYLAKDMDPGIPHRQRNDEPGNSLYFERREAELLMQIYAEAKARGLKAPKGGVSDGHGNYRVKERTDRRWTAYVSAQIKLRMWLPEAWKTRKVTRVVVGKKKPHKKFLLLPSPWPTGKMLPKESKTKTLDLEQVSVKLFRAGLGNQLAHFREGERIDRRRIIETYAKMLEFLS